MVEVGRQRGNHFSRCVLLITHIGKQLNKYECIATYHFKSLHIFLFYSFFLFFSLFSSFLLFLTLLSITGAGGQTIIFTNTKAECDNLITSNCFGQLKTQVLHGDIGQNYRQVTIKQFKEVFIKYLVW